ncbi:MAG: RnfABCDGE type electron transport complex subunit D [Oscillospiraceae bacterium]|nr:RnfABCDGE type electron transport complex subunit D [Oscillospiraceae bacterium]
MTVSSSPHIKSGETTTTIMADVIIALMPALVWGIYIFGFRALSLTVIAVVSCVFFEFLYQKIMKKTVTVGDLSAVVTGILIAFNLPVNTPLWAPVIGGAFAIIIVKQLFGGIGKNIVNPAIAARIFMFLSFNFMSVYQDITADKLPALKIDVSFDAVAGATPLSALKQGVTPDINLLEMILGQKGGCIGEISVLCLLIGGIYLLIRKVISWHVPLSFIAVVAVLTFLSPHSADGTSFALYEIFSGGLLLGAIFMATDYTTSPITKSGKLIFGAGCGLITVFIRYFGAYAEGVSFAIMIMNLFVWYIDKLTKPVKFGGMAKNANK